MGGGGGGGHGGSCSTDRRSQPKKAQDPKDRSVGGNGLGMRVIGGKEIPDTDGQLGAFVTRIYPNGVVDMLGEIKEGDQIVEWNGVGLSGKTFEEVQKVVSQSEGEVEIVLKCSENDRIRAKPLADDNKVDHDGNNNPHAFPSGGGREGKERYPGRVASFEVPEETRAEHHGSRSYPHEKAEIQLQVCYDKKAHILYVIVKQARKLCGDHDMLPDPFVKVYLLPGRTVDHQRRTRSFSRTSEPEWNQTMVYEDVSPDDLCSHYLEVTAWHYEIYRPNHYLGGVLVELSDPGVMDEQARWYLMKDEASLQAELNARETEVRNFIRH